MNVRVTPAASSDIRAGHDYYRERSRIVARRFKDEVRLCLEAIGERPRSFAVVHRDVRRAVLIRFPYIVLFRIVDDEAVVLGCFHGSRDPNLWRRR